MTERIAMFRLTTYCCYREVPVNSNKPIILNVVVKDVYDNIPREALKQWATAKSKIAAGQISYDECTDWGVSLTPCKVKVTDLVYNQVIDIIPKFIRKILKMRARGSSHIYGLTQKQYHSRMKNHGYTQEQSREILKQYKK